MPLVSPTMDNVAGQLQEQGFEQHDATVASPTTFSSPSPSANTLSRTDLAGIIPDLNSLITTANTFALTEADRLSPTPAALSIDRRYDVSIDGLDESSDSDREANQETRLPKRTLIQHVREKDLPKLKKKILSLEEADRSFKIQQSGSILALNGVVTKTRKMEEQVNGVQAQMENWKSQLRESLWSVKQPAMQTIQAWRQAIRLQAKNISGKE